MVYCSLRKHEICSSPLAKRMRLPCYWTNASQNHTESVAHQIFAGEYWQEHRKSILQNEYILICENQEMRTLVLCSHNDQVSANYKLMLN